MRQFRSTVVFLLLGVAGLLVVLPRVLGSTGTPGVEACRGLGSQEATERCLVDAMLGSGSLGSAARALAEVIEKDERLQLACHEATHEVGARLYTQSLDVGSFLRDPSVGVCEWGLVHGMLAGVTAHRSAPERVDALLDVCMELPDMGAQQACGDSVGHALWEIEGSFPQAVSRCMRAESPTGDACVSGVFMQFYRPVAPTAGGSSGETWVPPASREEVRALCDGLPEDRASTACAAAAHYAFAPDMQSARDQVLAAGDEVEAAGQVFTPVLDEALDFCAGFDAVSAERCAKETVRYALQMLRYLPATEVEALVCGRVAEGAVLVHCRNAAAAIL